MTTKNLPLWLSVALLMSPLAAATPALAATVAAKNVVLVHGAFAGPGSWDKVAKILRAKGLHVTEVKNPLTSLEADVAATKAVLAAQKGPTVLVGHSWGGVVIGEAGDAANVSALVYVAAFAPDKGESLNSLGAGSPPTPGVAAAHPDANGNLVIDPKLFPKVFAGDVKPAEANKMDKGQIPTNPAVFAAKADVAAWHDKPTFYSVSSNDMMIPPKAEAFFAQRMKATTITLPASHAAMVSHPKEVADLIIKATQAK